jgi:hypothetical protein
MGFLLLLIRHTAAVLADAAILNNAFHYLPDVLPFLQPFYAVSVLQLCQLCHTRTCRAGHPPSTM